MFVGVGKLFWSCGLTKISRIGGLQDVNVVSYVSYISVYFFDVFL